MNKTRILLLATAMAVGVSAPALAAFDRIGSLDVGYHPDRDTASPDFGGPVERLQFIARGSDVQCAYIRATFGDGTTRNVFSGRLSQGSAKTVDLPGTQRNIRRITSNCHGFQRGGSTIDLYADIGSYRDTWRRAPNWNSVWARLFTSWGNNGGPLDQAVNYWTPITTIHFSGTKDSESSAGGPAGRSVTAIALKPLDASVRCSAVSVLTGDGRRHNLAVNTPILNRGQSYTYDLPGGDRNIARISLACHAVNARSVNVQVLGRK